MSHLFAAKSRLIKTVIYIIYATGKIFSVAIKIIRQKNPLAIKFSTRTYVPKKRKDAPTYSSSSVLPNKDNLACAAL